MIPLSQIPKIINNGKLKTYHQSTSFLQVYYTHPDLPEGSYYVFVFTTLKYELIETKTITTQRLPIKYRAKTTGPLVMQLMRQLAHEAAEQIT
ncbi:MAG: hypothetical protein WDZ35_13090 [Crocinitomicaceae bacterium]